MNREKIKGWFYRWCPRSPPGFDVSTSSLQRIKVLPWFSSTLSTRVFTMIFIFTLLIGALNGFNQYYFIYSKSVGLRFQDLAPYYLILDLARVVFLPLIIFTASYLIGKRVNLEAEIKQILAYLFLGCFIGHFIGHLAINTIIFSSIYTTRDILLNIFVCVLDGLFGGFSSTFSIFFVSFSGIALASLRNAGIDDMMDSSYNDEMAGMGEESDNK